MKQQINLIRRISLATFALQFALILSLTAQDFIYGTAYPAKGSTVTYQMTFDDGSTMSNPTWNISGGTLVSSSFTTYQATANVSWPNGGSGSITFNHGFGPNRFSVVKQILVLNNCTTKPGTPQGILSAVYAMGEPSLLYLAPGSGGNDVIWSNSTSFNDTYPNLISTGAYFTTPPLTAPTTFYARTVVTSTGCYSLNMATVVVDKLVGRIETDIIRTAGVTTLSQIDALPLNNKSTTVSYIDGLGRNVQSIAVQSSPGGKDIVVPVEFDSHGRASKSYLPYTAPYGAGGAFRSSYLTEQPGFYLAANDKIANDSQPFAAAKYEDSPLGRITEQGNVGSGYQLASGNTQRLQYTFNGTGDDVRMFKPDGTSTQFFAIDALNKVISTDPDESQQIVFTDKAGRIILKRQQLDETIDAANVPWLETYYLYDAMGRVSFIISPKGVAALKSGSWSFTQAIKDNYSYQFVYDNRGRVIEKKVPGQAWMYFGYDKLNRLVVMQDGLLRAQNKWMFVKYDRKGRPVINGVYKNTTQTTRAALQTVLDGLYVSGNATFPVNSYCEARGTTLHGYTNVSFPKTNSDNTALEVWNINYFDNYDFDNNGSDDYSYTAQSLTGEHAQARAFLLPTGSKRLVLGTSTWLYTYVFYDKYRRPIQVRSNNHLSTTIDNLATSVYDFEGNVLLTKNYHKAGTSNITTVINKFEYDNKGRVLKIIQSNNGSADQILSQYEYNELGQLVDKKLHNVSGATFLQSVDLRYTIRSQLASINNSALTSDGGTSNDETNDYFGMELLYSEIESGLGNSTLYNGNISAIKWKGPGGGSSTTDQKAYTFGYDKSQKLETASYKVRGATDWTKETGGINETMSYDHNGNIKTLQRNQRKHQISGITVSFSSEVIDNLTYVYNTANGNSLEKITDAAIATGFNNGTSGTGNDYTYDVNGNLTSDVNKGISTIIYNFLGKPSQVTFSNGTVINYTYDAGGTKLKIAVTQGSTTTTTDYVGGFVYERVGAATPALSFFASPEGRVVKNGSTLEYQYAIADHQGNTRVVFTSATPAADAPLATFEGDANDKSSQYGVNGSFIVSSTAANHTAGGSKVVRMNQTYKIGPSRSVKVYPGDKIDMEVWEYHEGSSGFGTTSTPTANLITSVAGAFGGVNGGPDASGAIYNGVNSAITNFGTGGNLGDTRPAAYLNFIIFSRNYEVLDAGWVPAPANTFNKQKLSFPTKEIKEEGFVFAWLSYDDDSNNWVYFDDFMVTHAKSNIIQYNEYYPFGLQTAASWTRENTTKNDYLYNAANELNQTTGWYEMFFRGYDPTTGRMLQIDPYAPKFASYSTYNYALNNPVMMNDPSGGVAIVPPETEPFYYPFSAEQHYGGGGGGGGGHFHSQRAGSGGTTVIIEGGGNRVEIYVPALSDGMYTFDFSRGHWTNTTFYTQEELNSRPYLLQSVVNYNPQGNYNEKYRMWQADDSFYSSGKRYISKCDECGFLPALKETGNALLDATQFSFDAIGYIPGAGEAFDLANSALYAWRGDYVNSAFSASAAVPFLGWAATGTKLTSKIVQKTSKFDGLLKQAQNLYPNKAGKIELHHITPQYLGGPKNGVLMPLDAAYHQMITNEFRSLVPYGAGSLSPQKLNQVMEEVYTNYPLFIKLN